MQRFFGAGFSQQADTVGNAEQALFGQHARIFEGIALALNGNQWRRGRSLYSAGAAPTAFNAPHRQAGREQARRTALYLPIRPVVGELGMAE